MTVVDLVKKHEGIRLHPYRDSVGVQTIGYGHNLEANPLPAEYFEPDGSLLLATAEEVLEDDLTDVENELTAALSWFEGLDEVRQAVLIDLGFNLGVPKFLRWHVTLGALERGDFAAAADDLASSEPWATQVGERAIEDAQMLRTGQWPAPRF